MPINQRFEQIINFVGNKSKLAEKLGVKPSTIGKTAKGDTAPSSKLLVPIGEKLGISIDWLLFNKGEMFLPEPIDKKIINSRNTNIAIGDNAKNTKNSQNTASDVSKIAYLEQRVKDLEEHVKELKNDKKLLAKLLDKKV
jgi:transcriptional regulator with XRE-family HTH domain